MGKLIGFVGLAIVATWFCLLLTAVLIALGGDKLGLFGVPLPWRRSLEYAALFLVTGACVKYLFEDKK